MTVMKKTPGQIQREIDHVIKTGTPLRRVVATRVQAMRRERERAAAQDGLSSLGSDDDADYDVEREIAKASGLTGRDLRLVAPPSPRRWQRRARSTAFLGLAAIGVGLAVGALTRKPRP